ncbi:hypothetical protein CR513_41524, partial [Mucuna pruriens]
MSRWREQHKRTNDSHTTRSEESIIRGQPTAPITIETHQHIPTVIIRALCVEVIDKLRHVGAFVVCVKLKIDVIYDVPVTLPQGQVMTLNLVIIKRGNGSKSDDTVAFESLYQFSNALRKSVGICLEMLVVDVDSVQVILLDYVGE